MVLAFLLYAEQIELAKKEAQAELKTWNCACLEKFEKWVEIQHQLLEMDKQIAELEKAWKGSRIF